MCTICLIHDTSHGGLVPVAIPQADVGSVTCTTLTGTGSLPVDHSDLSKTAPKMLSEQFFNQSDLEGGNRND